MRMVMGDDRGDSDHEMHHVEVTVTGRDFHGTQTRIQICRDGKCVLAYVWNSRSRRRHYLTNMEATEQSQLADEDPCPISDIRPVSHRDVSTRNF